MICWFPPDTGTVVVALIVADKAGIGDVFYDGVAARASLPNRWPAALLVPIRCGMQMG